MKDTKKQEIYRKFKRYIEKDEQEKAKALIEKHGIPCFQFFNEEGMNMLFYSLWYERMDFVEWAIKSGWDINEKDEFGNTLLFCSNELENNESFVDFLIQNGMDVNHVQQMGYTPFLLALDMRCFRLARKLYEHGADVNACTEREDDTLWFIKNRMENKKERKEWVDLLLSEPERCAEPLLKKLKEMRLEFLYK